MVSMVSILPLISNSSCLSRELFRVHQLKLVPLLPLCPTVLFCFVFGFFLFLFRLYIFMFFIYFSCNIHVFVYLFNLFCFHAVVHWDGKIIFNTSFLFLVNQHYAYSSGRDLVIRLCLKILETFYVPYRMDTGLSLYQFVLWTNFNILHNSQQITFYTQSCLFFLLLCAFKVLFPYFLFQLCLFDGVHLQYSHL